MQIFTISTFLTKLLAHEELRRQQRHRVYAKGEHVFVQGEVCADVFFMRRGLVKLYFDTVDGKEWIKSFVADEGLFGSRSAQSMAGGSLFSVVCLEETELLSFPYAVFERVCLSEPEIAREVFQFTQWLGLKKEMREYQLLCVSAEDRYRQFMQQSAALAARLTQVDIARYLGITPIALSRIKKRVAV